MLRTGQQQLTRYFSASAALSARPRTMAPKKRTPPTSSGSAQASKKAKLDSYNDGVGESEIDDTVLSRLLDAVRESDQVPLKHVSKDSTVVYWMRNKDIRLEDNHALALAAQEAKKHSVPLIALHILSPGDYKAHDRGPPRVDFMLRAMRTVRSQLAERHIPLVVEQWDPPRKSIPSRLSERLRDWNAAYVFANLEYEVDELRRDTELTMLATAARQGKDKDKGKGKGEWQGQPFFLKDFCIVGPGECLTKQGKAYSVYSPWYRNWCSHVTEDLQSYTQDYGLPEPNDPSVRQHELVKKLFEVEVPAKVEGWEMDKDRRAHLEQLWPTDAGAAEKVLMRFCKTKICAAKFDGPPLEEDGEEVPMNKRKIGVYSTERNRPDLDGTSHISYVQPFSRSSKLTVGDADLTSPRGSSRRAGACARLSSSPRDACTPDATRASAAGSASWASGTFTSTCSSRSLA